MIKHSYTNVYLAGGCPHRSERTENFQTISVEIRGRDSLEASLAEYVKGELLEGDNAYYCESCQKKVTAKDQIVLGLSIL